MNKPIVAIMYDFDKTLSTTDMQDYAFIPNLGLSPDEFWGKTTVFTEKEGVERILSYMYVMVKEAKAHGIDLTKQYLRSCGKNIKFNPGVLTWFKRINEYGASKGVQVEHYLVSSGTKEIVEGCQIVDEFKEIYGCEFFYDENGIACWPKLAINYTQKTQYFFRIAKGATSTIDDKGVNEKTHQMRVPYSNIVYIGDGMTDIACMTLVKKNGGISIAVYPEKDIDKVKQIYEDSRCNFICPTDYSINSNMEKVMKLVIDRAATLYEIGRKAVSLANK